MDCIARFTHGSKKGKDTLVYAVIAFEDGTLVTAGEDGVIKKWKETSKGYTQTWTFVGHRSEVTCLTKVTSDSFASGSTDHLVHYWDLNDDLVAVLRGHTSWVYCITRLYHFSYEVGGNNGNNSNSNSSSSDENDIKNLFIDSRSLSKTEKNKRRQGIVLASGGSDKQILLWKIGSLNPVAKLQGHSHWVVSMCEIESGRLASGSADKTVKLWDLKTNTNIATLTGHQGWIRGLVELKSGLLASCAEDSTIRLWRVSVSDNQNKSSLGGESFLMNRTELVELISSRQSVYEY